MKTLKTQHTPGPWRVAEEQVADIGEKVKVKIYANGDQVAVANRSLGKYRHTERSLEEARANARLIAAAPELLADAEDNDAAIAQALGVLMRPGLDFPGREDLVDFLLEKRLKTQAAIAKAEGR